MSRLLRAPPRLPNIRPLHPRGTLLPQTCAYTESTPFDSVEDLPLWSEYAEIVRRNRPNPPGYFIARPPDPGSNS